MTRTQRKGFRAAPFFVLRTPLFRPSERLDPEVSLADILTREALSWSSPSFLEVVEGKRSSHEGFMPALVRYLERMQARPVPFSLSAGYSLGAISSRTEISLKARAQQLRHVRVSLDCVAQLVERRAREQPEAIMWIAAKDIVSLRDVLRVSVRSWETRETFSADVTRTAVIDVMLEFAQSPVGFADLEQQAMLHGASDPRSFVKSLIENALLVPAVTPSPFIEDELMPLEALGFREIVDAARLLRETRLAELVEPKTSVLFAALRRAGIQDPRASLVVDLVKPTENATLAVDVVREVSSLVDVARRLVPSRRDMRIVALAHKLARRYGDREVALVEALDPQRGFFFPVDAHFEPFDAAKAGVHRMKAIRLFERSLREGHDEVRISDDDLEHEPTWSPPESFAVMFQLVVDPLEIWEPHIGAGCAPGTLYFARALGVSPELRRRSGEFLREVAARSPEIDFADLAYFVPGSAAAVVQHPMIQGHEITLTPTSERSETAIDVNDIMLRAIGDRVALRSKSSGRTICVRVTDAIYTNRAEVSNHARFLYALSRDEEIFSFWDWGALDDAERLPRVRWKNHVLRAAAFFLRAPDTTALLGARTRDARWDAVQRLREKKALPRHVILQEGAGQSLPIDLDDRWSIDAWLDVARADMRLKEAFPLARSAVNGDDGPYVHQIVLPFFGEPKREEAVASYLSSVPTERIFPGDDYVCMSLVGDPNELLNAVAKAFSATLVPGAPSAFFRTYADEEPRIEIVFSRNGKPLHASLLQELGESLAPLVRAGAVRDISLRLYDREHDRFGNKEALDVSERIFAWSSVAALALHEERSLDANEDSAAEIIPPVIHSLRAFSSCMALSREQELGLYEAAALRFDKGNGHEHTKIWAGKLYRSLRSNGALEPVDVTGVFGEPVAGALRAEFAELKRHLRGQQESSALLEHLHAHASRIVVAWHPLRHLEAACHHVVARLLLSEQARSRS